jgi:hypothetical protein
MNATQQNMLVLVLLLGMAGVFAILVGVLSSQSLRDEGLRRVVKRWLGRSSRTTPPRRAIAGHSLRAAAIKPQSESSAGQEVLVSS